MSKVTKIILLGLVAAGIIVTTYLVSSGGKEYTIDIIRDANSSGSRTNCVVSIIHGSFGPVGCDIGSGCEGNTGYVSGLTGGNPASGCDTAQCVADNCNSMSSGAGESPIGADILEELMAGDQESAVYYGSDGREAFCHRGVSSVSVTNDGFGGNYWCNFNSSGCSGNVVTPPNTPTNSPLTTNPSSGCNTTECVIDNCLGGSSFGGVLEEATQQRRK